jgi:hypothetical protein
MKCTELTTTELLQDIYKNDWRLLLLLLLLRRLLPSFHAKEAPRTNNRVIICVIGW